MSCAAQIEWVTWKLSAKRHAPCKTPGFLPAATEFSVNSARGYLRRRLGSPPLRLGAPWVLPGCSLLVHLGEASVAE